MQKYTQEEYEKLKLELMDSMARFKAATTPEEKYKAPLDLAMTLLKNYDHLNDDGKVMCDRLNDELLKQFEETMRTAPDTKDTRKIKRYLRGGKGERLLAKPHMEVFNKPISNPTPKQLKIRGIFETQLQTIMDFYQDIVGRTFAGLAQFNQLSLIGSCIDELLAAFALSERFYTAQAMSHLRTIQEALDLTRLFREHPEWAELWNSDKPWQEVWRELRPGKVREKIKSDKFKEIYESLSSLGTHPTFAMMRLRCKKRKDDERKGRPQIDIKIGGTPKIKENLTVDMLLLLSLSMVLAELCACFGQYLHDEEVKQTLVEFMETFANYSLEFMIKPLREAGVAEAENVERNILESFELLKKSFGV